HQNPVHQHAEEKKYRQGDHGAKDRINVEAVEHLQGKVRSQHQEPGVRQVHDLHDSVNHGHADSHGGIDACQQQGLQQKVEILDSTHVSGSAYLFGIGATASPVAA